jgi:hypothetical protein
VLDSNSLLHCAAVHTVTLFIPALYWPHAGVHHDSPDVPVLRTLVGRGDSAEADCDDEQAWLCSQFGVERQADWPAAPMALLGTGTAPGEDFWLSADPVHLRVSRDQLILSAPESLSITEAEAAALCAALNAHFGAEALTFLAAQPHRWFVKTGRPVRIHTRSLAQAVGRDVDRLLPDGDDRMAWHRILNEAQMLLHAHPVNEQREQRDALPINSLWFSAGGTLAQANSKYQAAIGNSALLRGLAMRAAIPFTESKCGVEAIATDNVLIELPDAAPAAMCLDAVAWKAALENLERRWIAPLTALLKTRRIRQLVLATVANGRSYRWSVRRTNLWRLWRRAAALEVPMPGP